MANEPIAVKRDQVTAVDFSADRRIAEQCACSGWLFALTFPLIVCDQWTVCLQPGCSFPYHQAYLPQCAEARLENTDDRDGRRFSS